MNTIVIKKKEREKKRLISTPNTAKAVGDLLLKKRVKESADGILIGGP